MIQCSICVGQNTNTLKSYLHPLNNEVSKVYLVSHLSQNKLINFHNETTNGPQSTIKGKKHRLKRSILQSEG